MLEGLGFGYMIVVIGVIVFGIIKALSSSLSNGVSKLTEKPKRQRSENEACEALHCKSDEHVYGEVKTKKYSEYNGGTNIRMDEEGKFYLKVYNLKTGENHRLSAEYLYDLEELIEKTFKAMAERETIKSCYPNTQSAISPSAAT